MKRAFAVLILYSAGAAGSFLRGQNPAATTECDVRAKGAKVCAHQLYLQVSGQFLRDRDTRRAVAGFMRVTQLAPDYSAAWFNLAVLAEQRRDWTEAESDFERYLKLTPTGPDAKRATQELQTLKPYLAGLVTPDQAKEAEYDASIKRARLLLNSLLYREAISEASHAQSIDDSRWEAYAVVALVMYKQHKDVDGRRFADLAIQRSPIDQKSAVAEALTPTP